MIFKVLYEFCQFCIKMIFFAFVPIGKISLPTNFPDARMCKHCLSPNNGNEIAFQVPVLFLFGFEINVCISTY